MTKECSDFCFPNYVYDRAYFEKIIYVDDIMVIAFKN